MELKCKNTVNLDLRCDFAVAIGWVKAQWEAMGMGEFVVTSAKDGTHGAQSQHKHNKPEERGEALDVRTWQHWQGKTSLQNGETWNQVGKHSDALIEFGRMLQREGFRVVIHPEWVPGIPHLHIGARAEYIVRVD